MKRKINRRGFIEKSALGAAAAGAFLSCEERALVEKPAGRESPMREVPLEGMHYGWIGDLKVSRLICGGNLISGYSHARDLVYVSPLVRKYNTDEKILDTLELCELNGINTVIADPREHPINIFQRYWKERGGKMQWISESYPTATDLKSTIRTAIDNGAAAVYVQGAAAERLLDGGDVEVLGRAVEYIRGQGMPGGIGAHRLEVVQATIETGIEPDFYMKTLNHGKYWSARHPEKHDNIWAEKPAQTVEVMKQVEVPWIAFKTLAAGAIRPREGLRFVFEKGADFAVVGMFDWQVRENVQHTLELMDQELHRERPWRA
ncbi:MAG: twin-arginine translocation signal domain-containing protein [Candidatus Glassbacteria bacterium]|nr:twin-arginine translocation signal domain-containing protein [Candidatus Glassbacteria bacterium]